jgi:hypothetical protein
MNNNTTNTIPFFSSDDERLASEKEKALAIIQEKYKFLHAPDPTYFFNIGDEVEYSDFISCKIEEIYDNGKYYLLRCIARNINGCDYDYKYFTYRIACWHEVRPITSLFQELSKTEQRPVSFHNSNISTIINRYYEFGIDMNPEYQTDIIWSEKDREQFIENIFNCINVGRFVFVELGFRNNFYYEILDGKQRLSTIIDFYENRFSYKGKFFNELSKIDRSEFLNTHLSYGDIPNADKKILYTYFLMFNRKGPQIPNEHFEKLESVLQNKI